MDDTEYEVDGVDLHDGADGPSISMEQAHVSLATLESAIRCGNVETAVQMAEKLAAMQTAVCAKTDVSSCKTSEHFISITIHLEDQNQSLRTVVWKVQPSVSIRALKWKMFEMFGYSPDIQRWIIGNNVVEESSSLSDCGVETDGTTVFLYLKLQQLHSSADYVPGSAFATQQSVNSFTLSIPGSVPISSVSQTNSALSQPQTSPVLTAPSTKSANLQTTSIKQQVVGWHCPRCTLLNEPTRPGCAMCAADRPAHYKIPAGYQPSESERRRLEEERKLEKIMAVRQQSGLEDSLLAHDFDSILVFGELALSTPGHSSDEQYATELQQQEQLLAFSRYEAMSSRQSGLDSNHRALSDLPPSFRGYNGPY